MKILRPIGGTAGIFFPNGKVSKNGTCEHATKECLESCCVTWGYEHDDEYRVSPEDKKEIYHIFLTMPLFELCNTILIEMSELQTNILAWFVSGDCMDKDIPRLSTIMKMLSEFSVIYQNGFSKNPNLFGEIDILDRVHIAQTIKSKKEIGWGEAKIFAIPDYKNNVTRLYTEEEVYAGYCGSTEYKIRNLSITNNCKTCLRLKKGCFTVVENQ